MITLWSWTLHFGSQQKIYDHIDEVDMPYDADTRYPRRTAKIKHCWCEADLDTKSVGSNEKI